MAKFHPLKKLRGTASPSDKVLQKMIIIFQFSYQIYIIDLFIIFQTEISEINLNQLNGSCLIIFRSHQNSTDLQ